MTTTETLKAIAMLRESFEMGSEQWWECVRWAERVTSEERREREARAAGKVVQEAGERRRTDERILKRRKV